MSSGTLTELEKGPYHRRIGCFTRNMKRQVCWQVSVGVGIFTPLHEADFPDFPAQLPAMCLALDEEEECLLPA